MFIFPWYSLNDKIKITPNERKEDKLEISRTDHMRYMNVPFAINVMAGGEYEENKNIRFGGISDGKKRMENRTTAIWFSRMNGASKCTSMIIMS